MQVEHAGRGGSESAADELIDGLLATAASEIQKAEETKAAPEVSTNVISEIGSPTQAHAPMPMSPVHGRVYTQSSVRGSSSSTHHISLQSCIAMQ